MSQSFPEKIIFYLFFIFYLIEFPKKKTRLYHSHNINAPANGFRIVTQFPSNRYAKRPNSNELPKSVHSITNTNNAHCACPLATLGPIVLVPGEPLYQPVLCTCPWTVRLPAVERLYHQKSAQTPLSLPPSPQPSSESPCDTPRRRPRRTLYSDIDRAKMQKYLIELFFFSLFFLEIFLWVFFFFCFFLFRSWRVFEQENAKCWTVSEIGVVVVWVLGRGVRNERTRGVARGFWWKCQILFIF